MDEDDDDFYGPGHDETNDSTNVKREGNEGGHVERMDVSEDGQASNDDDNDDEDDDDDSDDVRVSRPEFVSKHAY
jgi:hypothetical protein